MLAYILDYYQTTGLDYSTLLPATDAVIAYTLLHDLYTHVNTVNKTSYAAADVAATLSYLQFNHKARRENSKICVKK